MKKFLVAIVALAFVLIGLVFTLPFLIGSDSLRPLLSRELSAASGAEISLSGPVRFSVFPDFGIVAHDLGYKAGDESLSVSAGRMVVSVRVMSLLSDRIQVSGIELDAPSIILADTPESRTGQTAEPEQKGDIFELAASYLERLAFDDVRINDGEVLQNTGGSMRPVATGIDLRLSAPHVEKPASISFAGTVDGQAIKLEGEIGSLRDLLNRQPATISISSEISPPPHPALASISATGQIQLAADGSYRIVDGEISSVGQPMRFDASYTPGMRDRVTLNVKAGTLSYDDFEPAAPQSDTIAQAESTGSTTDLSALRDIDVEFGLQAEAFQAGDAVARGLDFRATLQNGELDASMSARDIAGGSAKSGIAADFNSSVPLIRGSFSSSGIDIDHLLTLAGQQAPLSGHLATDLQYVFSGIDEATIRKSINMKGSVSVTNGILDIPQLAEAIGPGAERITAIEAKAELSDISNPLALSGTMYWNGEDIAFSTSVALITLLSEESTALTAEIRTRAVTAQFSGNIGLDGSASGRAAVETASLDNLLRWLNNDPGTKLGRFSYSGKIATNSSLLALEEARITLDDMTMTGSASVNTAGKTAITAALSVDKLDFAKFTGTDEGNAGTSSSGSPSSTAVNLAALKEFDADIRLKADRIGYGDVHAGPATAVLAVKGGVAKLSVPQAGFYNGTVTAEVVADGTSTPAIDLKANLNDVSALPLLTDAAAFRRLEGTLDAGLAIKGAGATTDTLARSLGGQARVVFSDGAIRGIDVAKLFNNFRSLLTGGYQENAEDKTEFTELSVTYSIENGVAKTDDLQLIGPLVRMDGSGNIDIADQTIDMRLNPRVVGSLNGQGGEFDVAGVGMPLIIKGPLSQPSVYPDMKSVLSNPTQALETLSNLGGTVGSLTSGATGGVDALKDALGDNAGATAGDLVTGVIQNLGQGAGSSGDAPADSSDLVGSLLQGVLKRGNNQDRTDTTDGSPGLPADQSPGAQEPAPQTTASIQNQDAQTANESASPLVPPIDIVPVPKPNPRRIASAPAQPAQETAPPKSPIDQAIETIAPQDEAADTGAEPADLINNLLKQLGN